MVIKEVSTDASRWPSFSVPEGSLAGALGKNSREVGDAMKQMDSIADDVIKHGTSKIDGLKTTSWKPGIAKADDCIAAIQYDGKLQSLMPVARKIFKHS
jgi:hypothetical protein